MPPVLDVHRLAALAEDLGDSEFLRETLGLYLSELPGRQRAMQVAYGEGDRAAMADRAHSLSSASAMLGLAELEASCRLLEARAPGADDEELGLLYSSWSTASHRAGAAATDWLTAAASDHGSNR